MQPHQRKNHNGNGGSARLSPLDFGRSWHLITEFCLTVVAYLVFHYTTVILLSLKYELSDF